MKRRLNPDLAILLMLIVFALITFTASRIARGDEVTDDRCKFAVLAAQIPPTVSIETVCGKPFLIMENDAIIKIDCRKYCKARGLKGEK